MRGVGIEEGKIGGGGGGRKYSLGSSLIGTQTEGKAESGTGAHITVTNAKAIETKHHRNLRTVWLDGQTRNLQQNGQGIRRQN